MRSRISLLIITGIAALGLVAAGCAEDDEEAEPTEAATATEAAATPTEAATATEAPTATATPTEAATEVPEGPPVPVVIEGFSLPDVTAAVGDTVIWTNADAEPHTVTALDGSFESNAITDGEFRHTFTAAGTFPYRCTLHEGMEATVTIQ